MSYISDELRVPLRFLRDLRRHVLFTYKKAHEEGATLYEAAEDVYDSAHRAYFSPAGKDPEAVVESQTEILDRYFDYHMRARAAEAKVSRYHDAYIYVSRCESSDIDIKHASIAGIVSKYLSWWQMRWVREQREIAHGFGWELTFARPQPESVRDADERMTIEDDQEEFGVYTDDCDVYDEEKEDGDDEVDERWGLYEVYSAVGEGERDEVDSDSEEIEEPEPEPQDVPLEALIEQSAQRNLLAIIADEYLKPAELVGIADRDKIRLRRKLFDTFWWARRNGVENEEKIREEVEAVLDDENESEKNFPPRLQRHSSGYGQFMRAQIDYEGASIAETNWSIIDEV
jgi:hypothetical protein